MKFLKVDQLQLKPYLFFTGKGGVGKTSTACALACRLAMNGKQILLISTDPASNLQDLFEREIGGEPQAIEQVPGLSVVNIDPIQEAQAYKEQAIGPYRDLFPADVIANMEEQLSGSCTVEVAAFNAFTKFLGDSALLETYDHIIFDTAPTGHTLRMLALPAAWTSFLADNTHGASCLGQLSGLEAHQSYYEQATEVLKDVQQTQLFIVARPEEAALKEAGRSADELNEMGMRHQILIVNGLLEQAGDTLSEELLAQQQAALKNMPDILALLPIYWLPLRPYDVASLQTVQAFLAEDQPKLALQADDHLIDDLETKTLARLVDQIESRGQRLIFTMGKGGVGKTTIAAAIALRLAQKGHPVHLATTDPAMHLNNVISEQANLSLSYIDETQALDQYREDVMSKVAGSLSQAELDYMEEDLRSPCTQEIAVFRAFAEIVAKSTDQIVVIDTAPTGHTLLLLDATQSYHKELVRTTGELPASVTDLLPRLRDHNYTQVVIVTLAQATPFYEAERLAADLTRAQMPQQEWVVNACLSQAKSQHPILKARAQAEYTWLKEIDQLSQAPITLVAWQAGPIRDQHLLDL